MKASIIIALASILATSCGKELVNKRLGSNQEPAEMNSNSSQNLSLAATDDAEDVTPTALIAFRDGQMKKTHRELTAFQSTLNPGFVSYACKIAYTKLGPSKHRFHFTLNGSSEKIVTVSFDRANPTISGCPESSALRYDEKNWNGSSYSGVFCNNSIYGADHRVNSYALSVTRPLGSPPIDDWSPEKDKTFRISYKATSISDASTGPISTYEYICAK